MRRPSPHLAPARQARFSHSAIRRHHRLLGALRPRDIPTFGLPLIIVAGADEAFARGWSPDGGRHGLFALGQGVIIDNGPTERQLNDWNIANDHAEGDADLDHDRDYEAG